MFFLSIYCSTVFNIRWPILWQKSSVFRSYILMKRFSYIFFGLKVTKTIWMLFTQLCIVLERANLTSFVTTVTVFVAAPQKSDPDVTPIEINQIRSVKVGRPGRSIPKAFEIFTGDKTYVLKAKDGKNAEEWVRLVSIAVASSHARDGPSRPVSQHFSNLAQSQFGLRTAVWDWSSSKPAMTQPDALLRPLTIRVPKEDTVAFPSTFSLSWTINGNEQREIAFYPK